MKKYWAFFNIVEVPHDLHLKRTRNTHNRGKEGDHMGGRQAGRHWSPHHSVGWGDACQIVCLQMVYFWYTLLLRLLRSRVGLGHIGWGLLQVGRLTSESLPCSLVTWRPEVDRDAWTVPWDALRYSSFIIVLLSTVLVSLFFFYPFFLSMGIRAGQPTAGYT